MTDRHGPRLVYSTDRGAICPGCGWPQTGCTCSSTRATEAVPARITAKLRLEKKGRGGKTVTVVYDLPHNTAFLKDLGLDLKKACGTGGAVSENTVELQGDHLQRLRPLLRERGFVVKG